ncbi:hypothetical protein [Flavobacterium tructae]|uniref:hypothetical protein n=1 Tax=Flavobacterium tructae TaxID=1114873 RepID=UPI0035A91F0F
MKQKLLLLIPSLCTLLFGSCSSTDAVTCYLPTAEISSNSPLVPGATLELETPFNDGFEVKYNWSGPNNFQSNLQNPIIKNVTSAMAGEYTLKTTKGICESIESKLLVEVNTPNIPCTTNKNTIVFTGSFAPIKFNSVSTSNRTDNFTMTASSSQGDLRIEFANDVKPVPGIYTICNSCPTSFMEKNEVCVSFNYLDLARAREGVVYISSSNGKLTAAFCNVIFKPSSFTLNASTTITEN